MRFLLILALISLMVFGAAGLVNAEAPKPGHTTADVEAAAGGMPVPGQSNDGVYDNTFATRFALADPAKKPDEDSELNPGAAGSSCVPSQGFDALGFYTLDKLDGKVDFSVYSRVLYYALSPGPLGNISIPVNWDGKTVTQAARLHGAKADLVIRNKKWKFDGKVTKGIRSTPDGLRMTKSFVLLNMVDEIVDTVNQFGFDGVVIDFRLPEDKLTQETFRFFIKRLKDRLKAKEVKGRANDLLKVTDKQLSVIVDDQSVFVFGNKDENADKNPILGDVISSTFDSVDLWIGTGGHPATQKTLVSEIEDQINKAIKTHPGETPPLTAPMLPNDDVIIQLLKSSPSVVWDVVTQGKGKDWSPILQEKIYGEGFDPKHQLSALLCTQRTKILGGLSVVTPLLVLMLVLSWLIYDFPWFVDRNKATLGIWGLLVIILVLFLASVYSLPSVDFRHIGVYSMLASLAVPVGAAIWTALSRMSRPDNP